MNKLTVIFIALASLLSLPQLMFCQENQDDPLAGAIQQVRDADIKGDFKLYMRNHSLFERLISAEPENHTAKYYLAYTEFKLFQMKQANVKVDVSKYYDSAVDICKELIEKKQLDAEAKIVLAGLYMMRLSENQMEAMSLMPEIFKLLDEAEAMPGKHPRAAIIRGIMLLNVPEMFGGSIDKAIDNFLKAISIFENGDKENPVVWGYQEAYAWLGQSYVKKNQINEAKQTYMKVLEIAPDYAWVKYVLLPALDKENKN